VDELQQHVVSLSKQLIEFERLKKSERKAHEEILRCQDLIRKLRLLSSFKEVLLKQKYENELDNLRAQLNSNKQLWQQLSDTEARERIVKTDLESTQSKLVTYEKIIEQLKDEMKKEQVEKTKLLQYKLSKSKRLEDLETKAREFEVLSSINLPKMIGMLESRDEQIASLKSKEKLSEGFIGAQLRQRETITDSFRRKLTLENRVKSEAIAKLEAMRNELLLVEGGADNGIAEIWKDKCRKLVDICKSFKEENDRL